MTKKIMAIAISAFGLTSCDAVMEQVDGQVRTAIVDQCQQSAKNFGIAQENIQPVCECGADKLLENGAAQVTDIDQARLEEIVQSCAEEIGSAGAGGLG